MLASRMKYGRFLNEGYPQIIHNFTRICPCFWPYDLFQATCQETHGNLQARLNNDSTTWGRGIGRAPGTCWSAAWWAAGPTALAGCCRSEAKGAETLAAYNCKKNCGKLLQKNGFYTNWATMIGILMGFASFEQYKSGFCRIWAAKNQEFAVLKQQELRSYMI